MRAAGVRRRCGLGTFFCKQTNNLQSPQMQLQARTTTLNSASPRAMLAALLCVTGASQAAAAAAPHSRLPHPRPAAVPCLGAHVGCNASFGWNNSGCCALADPEAVCCQTALVGAKGPVEPSPRLGLLVLRSRDPTISAYRYER